MRQRRHIRLLLMATLVWVGFILGGLPSYYLQYSTTFMVWFDLVTLVAITGVVYAIFREVKPERRLVVSLWFAFYFTVPLAIYDWLYCGVYLGHGIRFVTHFWFLSVYYVIPWVLFPVVALWLGRKGAGESGNAGAG